MGSLLVSETAVCSEVVTGRVSPKTRSNTASSNACCILCHGLVESSSTISHSSQCQLGKEKAFAAASHEIRGRISFCSRSVLCCAACVLRFIQHICYDLFECQPLLMS